MRNPKLNTLSAALLLLLATTLFAGNDLYNTSQLGQVTRAQEVYRLQVNDSVLIKGPFWYPRSAARNYLMVSDARGFITLGQLPDTLPTQHHFTAHTSAQYFTIDTLYISRYQLSGTLKTDTGGQVYVDTVPVNWCDSVNACVGNLAWGLTGNAGTDPNVNFIGTTDKKDLVFKRDNVFSGIIASNNTSFGAASYIVGTNTTSFGAGVLNQCTGTNNTAIGLQAGATMLTGSYNTFIGANADGNGDVSNAIALGHSALANSNQLYISDSINEIHAVLGGTYGTSKVLTSDASGNATWQNPASVVVAVNDYTGQNDTTTVASYTATDNQVFRIGGFLDVTAISGGTISVVLSFTTINGTPVQIVLATATTVGFVPINDITIRAQTGTVVKVSSARAGGVSRTFDVSASIELLR